MPKINVGAYRPDPIDLGKAKRVAMAHSQSSPGHFHFTIELEKAVITKRFGEVTILCTCKGFQNHRKCWHVAAMIGEEVDLDD